MTNSNLTEQNRKVVEDMYANGASGNFEAVIAVMDENVLVHEPPFLPYGGVLKGFSAFQCLLADISEYVDLTTVTVDKIIADGDSVIGVLHMTDKKTGKDLQLIEHSTVRDGKIVEMKIYYFDAGTLLAS